MDKIIERLFRKPTEAIMQVFLNNKIHISQIAKNIKATQTFTSKLINNLRKKGIVKIETIGRKNFVFLTKKGREITLKLMELKTAIINNSKGVFFGRK